MRVLITGAAGYLGAGLIQAFAGRHELRLLDVVETPCDAEGCESLVGSVADLDCCREAMSGVDAMVIAHMAPRGRGLYASPAVPFEVNVTGTANLYTAARDAGVKKAALISSIVVVKRNQEAGDYLTRDLPPQSVTHPYGLTKVCQESIARQFHLCDGIASAVLRPAYITDEDLQADKYGREASEPNWQYIDRRDIGQAARLALELPDLGYEVFYVQGPPDADRHADLAYTRQRLGWAPEHDFTRLDRRPT